MGFRSKFLEDFLNLYLWHDRIRTKRWNWISKMKQLLTFFNCLTIAFKHQWSMHCPLVHWWTALSWPRTVDRTVIWKLSSFDSIWCWLCISISLIIQVVVSPYSFDESIFSCLFNDFQKYTCNNKLFWKASKSKIWY